MGKSRRFSVIRIITACALLFMADVALPEEPERRHIPMTVDDVMMAQIPANPERKGAVDLNERMRAMAGMNRFAQDYLLGAGDVLQLTVFGISDLNKRELMLDSEGVVTLPFIGAVGLAGLTSRESEVKIAALYEASVMKNPQVSVTVKEFRSQFVNVLGAVAKPGMYQLTRRVFLLDTLAMAGGIATAKAEPVAYIHRAGFDETTDDANDISSETVEIDLLELLEKGDIRLNVPIYAGDVVSIPEKVDRFFYVLGDVNRGGAFEIRRGESITLTKALASAGGLMTTAQSKKSMVIRQNADGTTEQMSINANKVLKGEAPDMVLANNDVVFIPGSTTKTIKRGVLGSINSVVSALVYVGLRGY